MQKKERKQHDVVPVSVEEVSACRSYRRIYEDSLSASSFLHLKTYPTARCAR